MMLFELLKIQCFPSLQNGNDNNKKILLHNSNFKMEQMCIFVHCLQAEKP